MPVVNVLEVDVARPVSEAAQTTVFRNVQSEAGALHFVELFNDFAGTIVETLGRDSVVDADHDKVRAWDELAAVDEGVHRLASAIRTPVDRPEGLRHVSEVP